LRDAAVGDDGHEGAEQGDGGEQWPQVVHKTFKHASG
jgi:hypothetical protein